MLIPRIHSTNETVFYKDLWRCIFWMQRSVSREKAFLLLFEHVFNGYSLSKILSIKAKFSETGYALDPFSRDLFNGVVLNEAKIDAMIESCAKRWSKDRLSKVSLCILRIAIYEIMFREDIPDNVSANEAVNLAKKYGTDFEYTFVNGILGTICTKGKSSEVDRQNKFVGAVS